MKHQLCEQTVPGRPFAPPFNSPFHVKPIVDVNSDAHQYKPHRPHPPRACGGAFHVKHGSTSLRLVIGEPAPYGDSPTTSQGPPFGAALHARDSTVRTTVPRETWDIPLASDP